MGREFTIKDIVFMLLGHIRLIIVLSILCAIIGYGYTKYCIKPTYTSSALMYITNVNETVDDSEKDYNDSDTVVIHGNSNKVYASDFGTSQKIANLCSVLFKTTTFMDYIIKDLGYEGKISPGALMGSISISSVNGTQVMRITVTMGNPQMCADVANSFVKQAGIYYKKIKLFTAGTVTPVENATPNYSPISPNRNKNTMLGFAVGLVAAILIALFIEIIDTTIKPGDDLYKIYNIPVFAEIVDFELEGGKR